MALADLQKELNAANEAFKKSQADTQRLNQEVMTLVGAWLDAQTAADTAYDALARKQAEQARALMALSQAKLAIVTVWEKLQVEAVRRTSQA